MERSPERAAERVEHRPVDECRAVAGNKAVEIALRRLIDLVAIVAGEVPEGGGFCAAEVQPAGNAERRAELVEVVLVAQGRVLVEPLGCEQFGRSPFRPSPVLQPDPHARESLRRLGERDDSETKGHAQAHVALEELDRVDRQGGRGGVAVRHRCKAPWAAAGYSMPSNL
jgi:hypothetical protein